MLSIKHLGVNVYCDLYNSSKKEEIEDVIGEGECMIRFECEEDMKKTLVKLRNEKGKYEIDVNGKVFGVESIGREEE